MHDRQPRVWWVNQFAVVPSGTGGTRHYDMARELRRRGLDARIVASDLSLHRRAYEVRRSAWDPRAHRRDVDGVPFHWLPAGSYRANDWRRAVSMLVFAAAAMVFVATRRTGPGDVVIGSSPHLPGAFGAWAAARLRRLPFVLEIRDLWPESFTAVSGRAGGVQVRLMRLLADFLYRRSDHIVVLAEGSRPVVEAHGGRPDRITWLPNGVDTSAFPARPDGTVGPPVRFVYAGAHGPANGLDVVVDAAARLAERGRDDIEVVLVGDGPAKADLVDRARAGRAPVRFDEPVAKADVPEVLAAADAGLMVLADVELFRFGVSPNKLFDYLAAGLPVLTNVPGFVAGVVEQAGAGMVVAPGDPDALADGMMTMADRLLAGDGAWSTGRAHVEANFERRALAARLAAIVSEVARPTAPRRTAAPPG